MPKILDVQSVSKKFLIQRNRPLTLKESIIRRINGLNEPVTTLWALRDVSFSVQSGQVLGIIGHNGAGKSTLLRLLCGLGRPTSGHIQRLGKISGLLELGTWFHPDMTGRETIMTGGILNGLTDSEIRSQVDEIISFAELEEFIDIPVRNYSSGMFMRLAFSIEMNLDPEILVLDEILTVGDTSFQEKCLDRIKLFQNSGKTLIITSHDIESTKEMCDEVLIFEEGRLVIKGEPEFVTVYYEELMRMRSERRAGLQIGQEDSSNIDEQQGNRLGTKDAEINLIGIYNTKMNSINTFYTGDSLTIELEYLVHKSLSDMALSLSIYNEHEIKCYGTTIPSVAEAFGPLKDRCAFACELSDIPLLPGNYYINVGLHHPNFKKTYDYHWQMHKLDIISNNGADPTSSGLIYIKPLWELKEKS